MAGVDYQNVQPYHTHFDIPHHSSGDPLLYARRIHRFNGAIQEREEGVPEGSEAEYYVARYVEGRAGPDASGSGVFAHDGRIIGVLISAQPQTSSFGIKPMTIIREKLLEQGLIVTTVIDGRDLPRPSTTPTAPPLAHNNCTTAG